eukprot:1160612-Pelagomonas_calceolata.AAC.2
MTDGAVIQGLCWNLCLGRCTGVYPCALPAELQHPGKGWVLRWGRQATTFRQGVGLALGQH